MAKKSKTQRVLEKCDLFDWKGPGFCGGCNKDLGKPNRRWCSQYCTNLFLQEHSWQDARRAAIKRDGGCVKCGRDGTVPEDLKAWRHFMQVISHHGLYNNVFHVWHREVVDREGPMKGFDWKKRHKILRQRFREEVGIPNLDWWDEFEKLWNRAVINHKLEVNHKEPVKGKHADYGCFHHLDGLETLCGECHLEETRNQREQGLLS